MNKKVSRPVVVASAIAAVAFGALAAPAPASAHWSCGRGAPADIDTSGGHLAWYGATARVGSSTRCAVSSTNITGWSLDYHCYANDINGTDKWTYVITVSDTFSTRGWVNNNDLLDGGSRRHCTGDTNVVEAAPATIDWAATNEPALA